MLVHCVTIYFKYVAIFGVSKQTERHLLYCICGVIIVHWIYLTRHLLLETVFCVSGPRHQSGCALSQLLYSHQQPNQSHEATISLRS